MIIRRFTRVQRVFHLLLLVSFLIQAVTGVGRLYIETGFGRTLAAVFGGYEASLAVHKWVGLFMVALFLAHLVYALFGVLPRVGAGPDSMLPRKRDLGDLVRHLGWMLGRRPHPRLERWGYWEKFDYWAVVWGMVVLGGTGIILFDPLATSRVLKGWSINVALWIHRIEAILAMLHVFVIHFLVAHLRRSRFPMDEAVFTGRVAADEAREEHGDWIDRLRASGRLRDARPAFPALRALSYVVGLAAVACGIVLLVGGLVNLNGVTW